jgi:hypothetical protein
LGQSATAPAFSDRGAYETFGFASSHDSSLGWTSEMDTGLGYDFSNEFSVQAGVPLYLVSASTKSTQGTGTTTSTNRYAALGDASLGLSFHPKFDGFGFTTGLVGTAPTGNRTNGISTGRVTWNWNNRAEKDFNRLTPFVEATLGNSLGNTKRFRRPFTTLGMVSTYTGGTTIDLFKKVSFEASAYDVLPFGDQKIYSHNGKLADPTKKRSFEKAAVTSGTASLTKDHGFSGDFSVNPTNRVAVDLAYTRSIAYALDTYSATVSFRLGHVVNNSKPGQ